MPPPAPQRMQDTRLARPVYVRNRSLYKIVFHFTDGLYTKGTRAHTHSELIREWLWEPKGSSLAYI